MATAYIIYAEENDGFLVDGKPASTSNGYMDLFAGPNGGGTVKTRCFVAYPMNETGGFSNTSLDDKIRGLEKGGLWPYLESYKVFNCPSDKRWRKPRVHGSPDQIGGYRSYSIGAVLSRLGYGMSGTGEDKATTIKMTGFSVPSKKIVFLEEADGIGLNQNTWNMYLNQRKWWDPFAIRHNRASTFGFADGHADRHKWVDKATIKLAEEQTKEAPADGSGDYDWFRSSYIPGRMRK